MSTRIRKLTTCALFAAIALTIWVVESLLPPLTPIPGIKPGLANIVTVFAVYYLGAPYAAGVLAVRLVLGALLTGQVSALLYGGPAGIAALLLSILLKRALAEDYIWVNSALSAVLHNTVQILIAWAVTHTAAILLYLPLLVIAGIVAGSFTGLCARFSLKALRKMKR